MACTVCREPHSDICGQESILSLLSDPSTSRSNQWGRPSKRLSTKTGPRIPSSLSELSSDSESSIPINSAPLELFLDDFLRTSCQGWYMLKYFLYPLMEMTVPMQFFRLISGRARRNSRVSSRSWRYHQRYCSSWRKEKEKAEDLQHNKAEWIKMEFYEHTMHWTILYSKNQQQRWLYSISLLLYLLLV